MSTRFLSIDWGFTGVSLTYTLFDSMGIILVPTTSVGITESPSASGIYVVEVDATISGRIVWSNGVENYDEFFDATETPLLSNEISLPYQTVEQVDEYATTKLHTEAWDAADDSLKLKATYESSRIIDALSYQFNKLDPNQFHAFPLSNQTEVPEDILWAHSEIAIELLESDGESLNQSSGVISERFAAVGITYDPKNTPIWIRAGVPSELAWSYLLKYLSVPGGVILHRVS